MLYAIYNIYSRRLGPGEYCCSMVSKDKAKTFSLHQSISSILETCVSLLHLSAFGDESHLKAFGNLEKKECVRKNGGATTAPLQELNLLMQKGRLSKAEVDWLQKSLKRI